MIANKAGSLVFLKDDSVNLFAPDGSNMQLGDGKALLMDGDGNSFGLVGGKFTVLCDEVTMTATKKITLASSVDIGVGPVYQPAVLGTIFSTLFNAHVHLTTLPTLPTSPAPAAGVPPVTKGTGLSLGVRLS